MKCTIPTSPNLSSYHYNQQGIGSSMFNLYTYKEQMEVYTAGILYILCLYTGHGDHFPPRTFLIINLAPATPTHAWRSNSVWDLENRSRTHLFRFSKVACSLWAQYYPCTDIVQVCAMTYSKNGMAVTFCIKLPITLKLAETDHVHGCTLSSVKSITARRLPFLLWS